MKAIVQKIFEFLKSFFLRVRVAIELHVGTKRDHDELGLFEETQKGKDEHEK